LGWIQIATKSMKGHDGGNEDSEPGDADQVARQVPARPFGQPVSRPS
jgi:hypothetical protein